MSRVRDVNENPSYPIDADTSFDKEGYCLGPGNDSGETLRKASGTDTFMGVNHKSSYGIEDETIESGGGPYPARSDDGMGEMAVEQDGWPNVLCESGATYEVGDKVYLSGTAGVASKSTTSNTRVGTVAKEVDLSGASSPGHVPVQITGHV
jgi:hypothetical protein